MGILLILKEGGSLLIDSIGGPINEDIDLLPEVSIGGLSLAFRTIMEAISTTNTSTATQARAIVMGDI